MKTLKQELLDLSDFAYERLTARIADLSDEEYFWEPAPIAWNLHPTSDGGCRGDWGIVGPEQEAPITTIAWRLSHIIEFLHSPRFLPWMGDTAEVVPFPLQPTARGAIDTLAQSYAHWRACVAATPDDELHDPLGPKALGYADSTRVDTVLHVLDEFIHHGAEVATLRDLYRTTRPHDAFVVDVLGNQRDNERLRAADPSVVATALRAHPDLLVQAAGLGRWDVVPVLLELGFPMVSPAGFSALHYAAGANEVTTLRFLIDNGADLAIIDPTFNATPLGWAQYMGQKDAADYLSSLV